MARRTGTVVLVAAAAALVAASCGTTVPLSRLRQLSAGGGSSFGLSTSAGTTGASGTAGGTGQGGGSIMAGGSGGVSGGGPGTQGGQAAGLSAPGGGTGPGGATTSAGGTGQGGGSTMAGGSGGGNGPGVTATTINVAGAYDPDASTADSALGLANANPGDTKAETEAVVNYINAHGGIAHRQVNVVWYEASVQNNADQTDQQACATWTQDNKTFILGAGTPILDQCTANAHGIGILDGAILAETTPAMAQYPADYNLDSFTIDRGDKITIEGLAEQGYFSAGAKVGIATWDESDYQYGLTNGALPALAKVGVRNPDVAYIAVPQNYNDLGATSSSVASAVLKFHSAGIDHVILFDGPAGVNSSGILVLEWMQQANAQHYYPKYGLNSTSGFSALASDYPAAELVGSVGVGWIPSLDLTAADYQALPQNANQKTCEQIMTAAGDAPTNANMEAVQFAICEEFFFLQQAFSKISGPLNQQTAEAAINAMGSSFSSLTTFATYFSPTQHDGAQLVRNVAYYSSCDCYRYTSPAYNPG